MNRVVLFLFCLYLMMCASPCPAQPPVSSERIVLSTLEHPAVIPVFSPPIINAYHKLGFKVKLELVKGGRGLIESSSGRTDGELVRTSAIEDFTDTLIRIPVPLGIIRAFLVCHKSVVCDVDVLDDPRTRVGIINGGNAMLTIMEDKKATVVAIPDLVNLRKMLERGRFKYIIGVEHDAGLRFNYSDEFQTAPDVLFEGYLFHYVHKKHKAIVPALAQALEESLKEMPLNGNSIESLLEEQ